MSKYAVIFSAEINTLNQGYSEMAEALRLRALNEYGCLQFKALTEGSQEIAISYWQSLADIEAWRDDRLHQQAQKLGQASWYQNYTVEIVEIKRAYQKS